MGTVLLLLDLVAVLEPDCVVIIKWSGAIGLMSGLAFVIVVYEVVERINARKPSCPPTNVVRTLCALIFNFRRR